MKHQAGDQQKTLKYWSWQAPLLAKASALFFFSFPMVVINPGSWDPPQIFPTISHIGSIGISRHGRIV